MFDLLFLGRGARRAIVPLICAAILAYLGHHAFIGERGIYTHIRLKAEAETLHAELAELRRQRQRLERRIALIDPDSLDPDMLDERARAVLNFAHPDEITILKRRER
jgi:cell division protein FtsB